jgi:hydroxypyruvate isomerase
MKTSRRSVLKNIALGATAALAAPTISFAKNFEEKQPYKLKGNINHSVSRWTFGYLSLDDLCKSVKEHYRAMAFIVPCAIRLAKTICTMV